MYCQKCSSCKYYPIMLILVCQHNKRNKTSICFTLMTMVWATSYIYCILVIEQFINSNTMTLECRQGLGSPVFDKLEALLAKAMLSLPASKGFEIGSGFAGKNYFAQN